MFPKLLLGHLGTTRLTRDEVFGVIFAHVDMLFELTVLNHFSAFELALQLDLREKTSYKQMRYHFGIKKYPKTVL